MDSTVCALKSVATVAMLQMLAGAGQGQPLCWPSTSDSGTVLMEWRATGRWRSTPVAPRLMRIVQGAAERVDCTKGSGLMRLGLGC